MHILISRISQALSASRTEKKKSASPLSMFKDKSGLSLNETQEQSLDQNTKFFIARLTIMIGRTGELRVLRKPEIRRAPHLGRLAKIQFAFNSVIAPSFGVKKRKRKEEEKKSTRGREAGVKRMGQLIPTQVTHTRNCLLVQGFIHDMVHLIWTELERPTKKSQMK